MILKDIQSINKSYSALETQDSYTYTYKVYNIQCKNIRKIYIQTRVKQEKDVEVEKMEQTPITTIASFSILPPEPVSQFPLATIFSVQ